MDGQVATFAITNTKLYVLVVTLSTQDHTKLLDQLKSGFKRTINWNKYQSKFTMQARNQYLDYLIDPSFRGVNRLFALLFGNNAHRTSCKQYFLPALEKKDRNVMTDRKSFSYQSMKNDQETYNNI